jgi:glucose-1-phosphate thymidylyltransferase
VKAYVLAGGYATRMHPMTRDVPKALLEVGGRAILSHLMQRLRRLEGLTDVVIVTNDRFYEQLRTWADAQEPWVDLTVLNDGTRTNEGRLGALGDLQLAMDRIPLGDDHAIVLASDHLFDVDLEEVHRDFLARGRTTLLVRRVDPPTGPSPYNEVTLGDDGRIVRMREKPSDPRTDLSAIALYFMTADDLALLPDYLETGNRDAPGYFLSWLAARVPCYATPLRSRWFDIGSIEGLEEARAHFGGEDPQG